MELSASPMKPDSIYEPQVVFLSKQLAIMTQTHRQILGCRYMSVLESYHGPVEIMLIMVI